MKKTMLTMAALTMLAASVHAANENGNVTFSGNLKGLKDTLIVMTPNGQGMKRDTVLTKDGQFHFTVNVAKPTDIYAYTPGTLRLLILFGRHAGLRLKQAMKVISTDAYFGGQLIKRQHPGRSFQNTAGLSYPLSVKLRQ